MSRPLQQQSPSCTTSTLTNPYTIWLFKGSDVKLHIDGFVDYNIAEQMLTSISYMRNLTMRKAISNLAPGGIGWVIEDGEYYGFVTKKGTL